MKKKSLFVTGLILSLACSGSAIAEETVKSEYDTAREFSIHTIQSAPEKSQDILAWYKENFKLIPNVTAVMAESPALLTSYWELQKNLKGLGTLTPAQNNIVQTAIAYENECSYCLAGHSLVGKNFFKSTDEDLAALRTGKDLSSAKAEALKQFSIALYEKQGRVSEDEYKKFLDAGFTRAQALDVVGNIAAKVMTNFTNQLALTPLDKPFEPFTKDISFYEKRELVKAK